MSKLIFKRTAWLAALALVLAPGISSAVSEQEEMKQDEPRELIRTVSSSYAITQTGKQIGSETVTRSDYNDNSVTYKAKVLMSPTETVTIVIETELVLEAESHFPISYKTTKEIDQGGNKYTQEMDFELYSNVAVVRSRAGNGENTTRIVLPTGAAFVDANAAHHFYQLLFWYNKDLSGRQTFDTLEPTTKTAGTGVLMLARQENVSVKGEEIPASLYVLERGKRQPANIYVDEDDRIVRVEQNFMVYELTDWSEQPARSK